MALIYTWFCLLRQTILIVTQKKPSSDIVKVQSDSLGLKFLVLRSVIQLSSGCFGVVYFFNSYHNTK